MITRARWSSALTALLVAVACSGGEPRLDSGSDAGDTTDEGVDAADALSDVGPAEDPGWVRIPGFPDACYVERAQHPGAVLAFHWAPCSAGLPSCEMTVVDRSLGVVDARGALQGGNDTSDVIVWRLVEGDREVVVVTRADLAMAAWRQPAGVAGGLGCAELVAASAAGVGADAWYTPSSGQSHDRVTSATWQRPELLDGEPWVSTPTLLPPRDFLEAPSTSATTFAAMTTTQRIVAVEAPSAAVIGDGALPVVVGHTVLWNWGDATGARGIHLGGIGQTDTEVYRAPIGTHTYSVRADGEWIAWRAGADDPTGATVPLNELWAAPYRETSPLAARRLWTDLINDYYAGAIGGGQYANIGADHDGTHTAILVTDLASGARREYPFPDWDASGNGWHIVTGDPAWVTANEVAMPAGYVAGGEILHTVVRIDLRGLAPIPLPTPNDAGGADAGT